jgi:hypothetical protein
MVLRNSEALLALYSLADFERVARTSRPPQPSWFETHGVHLGIVGTNRGCVTRLLERGECSGCGTPVSGGTGDHLLPLDRGGPAGLENYIPLCRCCNSTKGTRDFLDWWERRGGAAEQIDPDILVSYCRLMWSDLLRRRQLGQRNADSTLAKAVDRLYRRLLSEGHRLALRQRVAAITGRQPW